MTYGSLPHKAPWGGVVCLVKDTLVTLNVSNLRQVAAEYNLTCLVVASYSVQILSSVTVFDAGTLAIGH